MKKALAIFICIVMIVATMAVSPAVAAAEAAPVVSDPFLSDIGFSSGTLNKSFLKTTYRYTLYLDESQESTIVTPIKSDPGATMTIDKKTADSKTVSVANGKHKYIRIKVVSQGNYHSSRVYTIKIIRPRSAINDLATLDSSSGQLEPAFDPAVNEYKINLDEFTYKVNISASKLSPLSTLRIDERRATSKTYTIGQGKTVNAIINVRSQSGITKKYTVAISRAATTYPDQVSALIEFAKTNLGKPYVRGGKGPDSFDCSGFAFYCLKSVGIQMNYMTSLVWPSSPWKTIGSIGEMLPGDILCFSGHVGIYLGDSMMIDAVPSEGGVRVASCVSPYWTSIFICGKRVIGNP